MGTLNGEIFCKIEKNCFDATAFVKKCAKCLTMLDKADKLQ